MKPDLQKRLVKASRTIDRLTQIRHITEETTGTDLRRHLAGAAVAAAEYVAAVTGNEEEMGVVHRAYEEILAAIEGSQAVEEMLRRSKVSEYREAKVHRDAADALMQFRLRLSGVSESDQ